MYKRQLKTLYDLNAFKEIAFTGGTALRILHNTSRYSEDLDFSVLTGSQVDLKAMDKSLRYKIDIYAKGVPPGQSEC